MIRNIIFDLDGTLLDTASDIHQALNDTFIHFNMPKISKEKTIAGLGHGTDHLLGYVWPMPTIDAQLLKQYKSVYLKKQLVYQLKNAHPFQGIEPLLATLKSLHIRCFILTNKPHQVAVEIVNKHLNGYIAKTLGQIDGVMVKPDIKALQQLMNEYQIQPNETLFVGDSTVDIITGKNASMKTVAVSWGYNELEQLINEKPDYLIDQPLQLVEIINQLNKKLTF